MKKIISFEKAVFLPGQQMPADRFLEELSASVCSQRHHVLQHLYRTAPELKPDETAMVQLLMLEGHTNTQLDPDYRKAKKMDSPNPCEPTANGYYRNGETTLDWGDTHFMAEFLTDLKDVTNYFYIRESGIPVLKKSRRFYDLKAPEKTSLEADLECLKQQLSDSGKNGFLLFEGSKVDKKPTRETLVDTVFLSCSHHLRHYDLDTQDSKAALLSFKAFIQTNLVSQEITLCFIHYVDSDQPLLFVPKKVKSSFSVGILGVRPSYPDIIKVWVRLNSRETRCKAFSLKPQGEFDFSQIQKCKDRLLSQMDTVVQTKLTEGPVSEIYLPLLQRIILMLQENSEILTSDQDPFTTLIQGLMAIELNRFSNCTHSLDLTVESIQFFSNYALALLQHHHIKPKSIDIPDQASPDLTKLYSSGMAAFSHLLTHLHGRITTMQPYFEVDLCSKVTRSQDRELLVNNIQDAAIVILEMYPNDARAPVIAPRFLTPYLNTIIKQCEKDEQKRTVIIDFTLNHIKEMDDYIAAARNAIQAGSIQLVFIQSGAKQVQLGTDLYAGGLFMAYFNPEFWPEMMCFGKDNRHVDVLREHWFGFLYSKCTDLMVRYFGLIRAQTATFQKELTRALQTLEVPTPSHRMGLRLTTDSNTGYLALSHSGFGCSRDQISDKEIEGFNKKLYEHIKRVSHALGFSYTFRQSFGFYSTNMVQCVNALRITPGITDNWKEEVGLLCLIHFALNRVHFPKELLNKKDRNKFFNNIEAICDQVFAQKKKHYNLKCIRHEDGSKRIHFLEHGELYTTLVFSPKVSSDCNVQKSITLPLMLDARSRECISTSKLDPWEKAMIAVALSDSFGGKVTYLQGPNVETGRPEPYQASITNFPFLEPFQFVPKVIKLTTDAVTYELWFGGTGDNAGKLTVHPLRIDPTMIPLDSACKPVIGEKNLWVQYPGIGQPIRASVLSVHDKMAVIDASTEAKLNSGELTIDVLRWGEIEPLNPMG